MKKVSVICLCYNHSRYVGEAVMSVINQSYPEVELIVVDDRSQDESVAVIKSLIEKFPSIYFIKNESNLGMCRSFNKALALSTGEYIVNLAADDYFHPEKLEKDIKAFSELDQSYGVVFSDAWHVDSAGNKKKTFYKRVNGKLIQKVESGNVFTKLVQKYQIPVPTVMARREVYEYLNGFDESLSYEDYDFFIRSSKKYHYYFMDEVLTYVRDVEGSVSKSFYRRGINPHLESTLKVLKKYLWLCESKEEQFSAIPSIRYHMRQALFLECYDLASEYYTLLSNLNKTSLADKFFYVMSKVRIPLFHLYKIYKNR